MIISRSNNCPKCGDNHGNSCYIVYHNGWKCFSCGASNYKSDESFAFRELRTEDKRNLFIPHHTFNTQEFSPQCLRWLYSYYVTDKLIKKHKIAFCPSIDKDESLMFPITYASGVVEEYQRRFFPKNFYSSSGVKATTFIAGSDSDTVVIVEDYISAIRVGEFCPTLCLFGTSLTELNKKYIVNTYKNIIIWLDNDEPGIQASNKIKKEIITHTNRVFNKFPMLFDDISIKQIFSEKSPKELNDNAIKRTLEKTL